MKKTLMTVGQALTHFLDNQYVEFDGVEYKFVDGIFTIFGHGIVAGFGEALAHSKHNLKYMAGRNEQGMVHAATAFARQKRRLQIWAASSSIGPGAANMITGAATATANRIPVLLLPADTYACRQPDPVLQQIEMDTSASITTNDAFKAVCKYFDRVNRPEQLMTAMIKAMQVLTNPANTGAVCVSIPQDVGGEVYEYPESFLEKRVHHISRREPNTDDIKRAVSIIKNAKRPLIICGGGVRYSLADEVLLNFCNKFNIPIGETQAGKGVLMDDCAYNLGGIGATGASAANIAAKEADLIIGLGTRYSDFTTSSKSQFEKAKHFININVNEMDSIKFDALAICADVKLALLSLSKELANYKAEYSKEELESLKNSWQEEYKRLANIEYKEGSKFIPEVQGHDDNAPVNFYKQAGGAISETAAIAVINDIVDKNAVVVGSSGSLPGDLQRMWRVKDKDTYHVEYAYSCMGYEINGAVGVKIACPEREVYAMVGDGSFIMGHSEVASALMEGIKINIMLFDNAGFGCINNLQRSCGIDSFGTEFKKKDGSFQIIDFAKIAEGYGMKSYRVHTLEELKSALEDSKKQKVSTLIDMKVMPKTMTHGYESFWRVGVAEYSNRNSVMNSAKEQKAMRDKLFPY